MIPGRILRRLPCSFGHACERGGIASALTDESALMSLW